MIKKTILAAIFCTACFTTPVFAQAEKEQENVNNKSKSTIRDNWFISLGASANLLIGEQDHEKNVGDRLKFGGELSVGKWFNPNFGMRLQYSGGNVRGFNYMAYHGGGYARPDRSWATSPIGGYDQKWTDGPEGRGFWQDFVYESLMVDVMMNLTTLMRGYHNESALVDVVPFAGFGWMHSIKSNTNPTMDNLGAKVGVRVNFNLNPKWAIYVEPQSTITSEQFDGYKGTRGSDMIVNLMAGVQFNVNKHFFNPEILSQEEIDHLNNRINEQYQMIENQQDILDRHQRMLNELQEEKPVVTPSAPCQPADKGYLPDYIRFTLNSSTIATAEKTKLEEAATYLKSHPQSKLLLKGYADKKTGNHDYNYRLSCRRVEAVAQELQSRGISKSRLIIQCVGDKEQPYEQNDWNRVVILVER